MSSVIHRTFNLGSPPWPTSDPFLFCVHHRDAYPQGDATLAPKGSLAGRNIGQDFSRKDGWSMYHGSRVPGFPAHPHRGFETITVARSGHIDHADSLGARARFGNGDVQWMTAGKGVVHSEMFPLLHQDRENPAELFQIWLNLPKADKMVDPHFTMLWSENVPGSSQLDAAGKLVDVTYIAGRLGPVAPPSPPPHSWASRPEAAVAILAAKLEAGAQWDLPLGDGAATRTLYFFEGQTVTVNGTQVDVGMGIVIAADQTVTLVNGPKDAEILLLQGVPIGEPVVQYGPFVMNTRAEIQQAYNDYRATNFGGWPYQTPDPNHGPDAGRFAVHADGREERPV